MPSTVQVAGFQHLLGRISRHAGAAVAAMFHAGNTHNYPEVINPFLAGSAQLSTAWYHSLAPDEPYAATPGPLPPVEALHANADYAMSTTDPVGTLQGATDRHIFETSGATIVHNADLEHVRYARYASATACAFCRMLATRQGHLYTSAEAAIHVVGRSGRTRGTRDIGALYHDFCHCVATPIRPGDSYTPPDYTAQWQKDYEAARADPDTHGFDDMVNHMRRTEYARQKAAGRLPERAPAPPKPKPTPKPAPAPEPEPAAPAGPAPDVLEQIQAAEAAGYGEGKGLSDFSRGVIDAQNGQIGAGGDTAAYKQGVFWYRRWRGAMVTTK